MRIFVSHAGRDRVWAEWIAWQLEHTADVEVELDSWDWQAGDNFIAKMNSALAAADAVVAVCSEAYFDPARWTSTEWQAAVHAAKQRPRFLLPVRIDDAPAPPLLASLITVSLHNKPAEAARQALLSALRRPGRPHQEPGFPAGVRKPSIDGDARRPRLPGALPEAWGEVPIRNEAFAGREHLLDQLRDGLCGSGRSIVQAINGAGGVGKTQLAGEYTWRFASDYDAVWWVHAEQPELITEQYVAFAAALNLVGASDSVELAIAALRRYCRTHDRWLLVLDNAATAEGIYPWLLPGPGHILVTSRDSADWSQIATGVPIGVFTRQESIAFLHTQLTELAKPDADAIAKALGDLPLALAQAASVLADGVHPADYLRLLADSAAAVLAEGRPLSYPVPLAAAIIITLDQLTADEPAATQLLRLCAVMAPSPIPVRWFSGADSGLLGRPISSVVHQPLSFGRVLRLINRCGLAKLDVDRSALMMHRLTQAVLRDRDPAADEHASTASVLLCQLAPQETNNPATWPAWAQLLPHILALDLKGTTDSTLAWTAGLGIDYLLCRGDFVGGHNMAQILFQHWSQRFGPDYSHTRWAATYLALALHWMGEDRKAQELNQQLYDSYRAERGADDHDTLGAAGNLANNLRALGEYQRARELDQDILIRRRRIFGPDHPDTINTSSNLAVDLHELSEHQQAGRLNEDALTRRRRVLGEDHPDTLTSASNLAGSLYMLGRYQQAVELNEDTLARRRRVLGEDHPDTLASASNLAASLRKLGKDQQAAERDEGSLTSRRRILDNGNPDILD